MSDTGRGWQAWQMGMLERRGTGNTRPKSRAQVKAEAVAHTRRREDQISLTLFNLAKEEAEKKGFEKGHAEGLEQGRAEGIEQMRAEHAQALEEKLAAAVAPIQELAATYRLAIDGLDDKVSYALVELALATAQQIAGRALELKPEHILDDIEELMGENPTITGTPTLFVSIDDMALVERHLTDTLAAAGWQLRADTTLSRGDCRVETDQREIDATTGDRWARLLHAVGHGEH